MRVSQSTPTERLKKSATETNAQSVQDIDQIVQSTCVAVNNESDDQVGELPVNPNSLAVKRKYQKRYRNLPRRSSSRVAERRATNE